MLEVSVKLKLLELMQLVQLLELDGSPASLELAARLNGAAVRALKRQDRLNDTGSSMPSEAAT